MPQQSKLVRLPLVHTYTQLQYLKTVLEAHPHSGASLGASVGCFQGLLEMLDKAGNVWRGQTH
jgi:hypothetical protein